MRTTSKARAMKGIGSCGESAKRGRGDVSLGLPQTSQRLQQDMAMIKYKVGQWEAIAQLLTPTVGLFTSGDKVKSKENLSWHLPTSQG